MPGASPSGVITLLTDFGTSDPFVGVMTGAILCRFPRAMVVNLCHGLRAQGISEAAFWLERCFSWFPPGTVHVAVVDPGVGSERRLLGAACGGHYFLVPDNGLLAPGLLEHPDASVRQIDLARLGLKAPSATFHGRDLFAPLAAWLASGQLAFGELGAPASPLPCRLPPLHMAGEHLVGEVITIDRFGNLITNLDARAWQGRTAARCCIAGQSLRVRRTYSDVSNNELVALVNSFGVLEVAQRDGSAERSLGCGRGSRVELTLEPVLRDA